VTVLTDKQRDDVLWISVKTSIVSAWVADQDELALPEDARARVDAWIERIAEAAADEAVRGAAERSK